MPAPLSGLGRADLHLGQGRTLRTDTLMQTAQIRAQKPLADGAGHTLTAPFAASVPTTRGLAWWEKNAQESVLAGGRSAAETPAIPCTPVRATAAPARPQRAAHPRHGCRNAVKFGRETEALNAGRAEATAFHELRTKRRVVQACSGAIRASEHQQS